MDTVKTHTLDKMGRVINTMLDTPVGELHIYNVLGANGDDKAFFHYLQNNI